MTSDVLLDTTIRQGSIVLQPSRTATTVLTNNDYKLAQPIATAIEAKYTDRFDDKAYYFTPDVIDGNP